MSPIVRLSSKWSASIVSFAQFFERRKPVFMIKHFTLPQFSGYSQDSRLIYFWCSRYEVPSILIIFVISYYFLWDDDTDTNILFFQATQRKTVQNRNHTLCKDFSFQQPCSSFSVIHRGKIIKSTKTDILLTDRDSVLPFKIGMY